MTEEIISQVRVLIEKFLYEREAKGYSAKQRELDGWGLEYYLEFLKNREEESLSEVTGETVNKYQMHLYSMAGKRVKTLSLTSQLHILVSLKKFCQWLVQKGELLADPTAWLELPKQKQRLPVGVMSKKEVEKVLNAPDVDTVYGLRDRAILELLYSSGLRNQELRNLTIYDVNVNEGEVRVRQGKGGKDRVTPLGEIAGKYVELYLKEARGKILNDREDPGYLFLSRHKRQLCGYTLNKYIVKKYVNRAGLKKRVTTHGFRHTCATHLLQGRANIRHIQALLGHKSLVSTQIYTHVEIGDLKKELKRCHPRERKKP